MFFISRLVIKTIMNSTSQPKSLMQEFNTTLAGPPPTTVEGKIAATAAGTIDVGVILGVGLVTTGVISGIVIYKLNKKIKARVARNLLLDEHRKQLKVKKRQEEENKHQLEQIGYKKYIADLIQKTLSEQQEEKKEETINQYSCAPTSILSITSNYDEEKKKQQEASAAKNDIEENTEIFIKRQERNAKKSRHLALGHKGLSVIHTCIGLACGVAALHSLTSSREQYASYHHYGVSKSLGFVNAGFSALNLCSAISSRQDAKVLDQQAEYLEQEVDQYVRSKALTNVAASNPQMKLTTNWLL
jgi:uncharacterized ferredoxin-like protein